MLWQGLRGYFWYFSDWRRFARLSSDERLALRDAYPQLHDRTSTTAIDPHYFFANGWAMRRIAARAPRLHMDVASQTMFVNLLAAYVRVVFVDYRPLIERLAGLSPIGGSLANLPFADQSLASVSCLHVLDNVGLGRYGDPVDPGLARRGFAELARVVKPGGDLYVAVPVGVPRVCFNAHRIHDPLAVPAMVAGLDLVDFSLVTDAGEFVERVTPAAAKDSEYACGLYHFRRPLPGR